MGNRFRINVYILKVVFLTTCALLPLYAAQVNQSDTIVTLPGGMAITTQSLVVGLVGLVAVFFVGTIGYNLVLIRRYNKSINNTTLNQYTNASNITTGINVHTNQDSANSSSEPEDPIKTEA